MDLNQKEELADELFRAQPHIFGSLRAQKQLGVSLEKMDFLLDILLICFQAMKESGPTWPLITEDEQDRQMKRYVTTVQFREDLPSSHRDRVLRQYLNGHPEKELLAFVQVETVNWLQRIVPEESDRYIALAADNIVNCIAFVPMPEPRKSTRRVRGQVAPAFHAETRCCGKRGGPGI